MGGIVALPEAPDHDRPDVARRQSAVSGVSASHRAVHALDERAHADRLRLTVLGCSTAAAAPGCAAPGYLVEWGTTALLLDVGQGVIRNLQRVLATRATCAP